MNRGKYMSDIDRQKGWGISRFARRYEISWSAIWQVPLPSSIIPSLKHDRAKHIQDRAHLPNPTPQTPNSDEIKHGGLTLCKSHPLRVWDRLETLVRPILPRDGQRRGLRHTDFWIPISGSARALSWFLVGPPADLL
jgi:hypothetical protein